MPRLIISKQQIHTIGVSSLCNINSYMDSNAVYFYLWRPKLTVIVILFNTVSIWLTSRKNALKIVYGHWWRLTEGYDTDIRKFINPHTFFRKFLEKYSIFGISSIRVMWKKNLNQWLRINIQSPIKYSYIPETPVEGCENFYWTSILSWNHLADVFILI